MDALFELADGSLLHIEFQTRHRKRDLDRFLEYDLHLVKRYRLKGVEHIRIHTVVIYGAGIHSASDALDYGSIRYGVHNLFLGSQDGRATLQRLEDRLAAGQPLTADDLLDLALLPIMRWKRPMARVLDSAAAIVRRLEGDA